MNDVFAVAVAVVELANFDPGCYEDDPSSDSDPSSDKTRYPFMNHHRRHSNL
jgi:hypothetical protein